MRELMEWKKEMESWSNNSFLEQFKEMMNNGAKKAKENVVLKVNTN